MSNYVVRNMIPNSYHEFNKEQEKEQQEQKEQKQEQKQEQKEQQEQKELKQEQEEQQKEQQEDFGEKLEEEQQQQLSLLNHEEDRCFICFETYGKLIKPCKCDGTNYSVHRECLNQWIKTSKKDYCQICNYQYNYELVLKPSCDRFNKKNCVCNNNITLEDQDQDQDQDNLTNDTTYIFFLSLFIYIPLYVILTTTLYLNYELLLSIYWSLFFIQPIFYLFLRFKLYFNLDIPKIIRNTQLLLCFVTFIIVNIIAGEFEARCNINCMYERKICDNNCSYFTNIPKSRKSQVFLVDNRLIIFGITLLVDLIFRLRYFFFYKRIASYNRDRVFMCKIYPQRNN